MKKIAHAGSAYAGLRLAARAGNPDPENNPNEPENDGDDDDGAAPKGKNKEKKPMDNKCENCAGAEARGVAQGAQAANQRFSAVLASDHYAGREKLAHKMLANFSLSAEDITGMLAESPKGGVEASSNGEPNAAAEEVARKEMQAALAAQNSTIDASGGAAAGGNANGGKPENHAGLWEKAIASNNPSLGRK